MSRKILNRLESISESKNTKDELAIFVKELKDEYEPKLPKVLEEKLNNIKNNPLDEPKIAELKNKLSKKVLDKKIDDAELFLQITEFVIDENELEQMFSDGIGLEQFAFFGKSVVSKVFDLRFLNEDKESVLKEIESQNNLKVLSYKETREIKKARIIQDNKVHKKQREYSELVKKLEKVNSKKDKTDKDNTYIKKLTASLEKVIKEYSEIATENEKIIITFIEKFGIDIKDITDWEKELLIHKIVAMSEGQYTPPMGKN